MFSKILTLVFCTVSATFFPLNANPQTYQEHVSAHWMTNYDEAARQAQSSSKPMVVLFTGSDWCAWCKKLENSILSRPEFAQSLNNQFILVKLDFPHSKPVPANELARNEELQKQFAVDGFPTIIVLNPDGQKLGQLGYLPVTPQEYANSLLRFVR